MMWLDDLHRSITFRRKVKRASLRIIRIDTMPIDSVQFWREDMGSSITFPVERSPHYELLLWYANGGIRFTIEESGLHPFRGSAYYRWHVALRGFQHPRSDGWIEDMARRLIRLYKSIARDGYRCRCVADRIAVLPDNRLWDGGHRLACLAILGWKEVPVVWVGPR